MICKRYFPIVFLFNPIILLHGAASDTVSYTLARADEEASSSREERPYVLIPSPLVGDEIAQIGRGLLIPNLFDIDMITVPRTNLTYRPIFHGKVKVRTARGLLRGFIFGSQFELASRQFRGTVGFIQGSDRDGVETLVDHYVAAGGEELEKVKTAVIQRDPSRAAKLMDAKFEGKKIRAWTGGVEYWISFHIPSATNVYGRLADQPILAPSGYQSLLAAVITANKGVSRAIQVEAFKSAAIGLCEKREADGLSTERMQVPILVLRENIRRFNEEMFGHE